MAHTNKQHKLRDNVNAHRASVTSYTTTYSSADINVSCSLRNKSLISVAVIGDIFNKNIRDNNARSNETKHNSPNDVNISLMPTSLERSMNLETLAGIRTDPALRLVARSRGMWRPPLDIFGGGDAFIMWLTCPFIIGDIGVVVKPPGLTLLELPNECFDVLNVDTFNACD